ncbi:MAG: hypothetical protein O3A00_14390, partial [Planctomycetota bacterium]|nr:hypothetical protein [Planctomycetota bacterium]
MNQHHLSNLNPVFARHFAAASVGFVIAISVSAVAAIGADSDEPSPPHVFDMPAIFAEYANVQQRMSVAIRRKAFPEALELGKQSLRVVPHDPVTHYNVACVLARTGKADEALNALQQAVDSGFRNVAHIRTDEDLATVRDAKRFKDILETATVAKLKTHPWLDRKITSAVAKDGVVTVQSGNTQWDPKLARLRAFFDLAPKPSGEVVQGHGRTGDLLRQWFKDGTAAGNHGDFYDNHDRDHSNLKFAAFPQLTRIEFSADAKQRVLDHGFQRHFLYNAVTIGNSSTAMTQGPFWRSQARLGYTNPALMAILDTQYSTNHLYLYPEHRDHDAGRNGKGGYGDVFPANSPYMIVSQGSSYTDQPFLDALACTLAAFRPDTKKFLIEKGAIVPTLQMVFRMSNLPVANSAERYMTGIAHPSVFDSKQLDVPAMVTLAHSIEKDSVPPMIRLKVVEEDQPLIGRDFFDTKPNERLFDTSAAIARVARSLKYQRRMVVSAEASHDLNDRPLTWNWAVLRGDVKRITITPMNPSHSVVELKISYHERRPIRDGHDMESSRVDIGVFVNNGVHHSAPGFVTVHFPANETRSYDETTKRLLSVNYADQQTGGNYEDPLVSVLKRWKDDYHYATDGSVTGWTRTLPDGTLHDYTSAGEVIVKKGDDGRPLETRPA